MNKILLYFFTLKYNEKLKSTMKRVKKLQKGKATFKSAHFDTQFFLLALNRCVFFLIIALYGLEIKVSVFYHVILILNYLFMNNNCCILKT